MFALAHIAPRKKKKKKKKNGKKKKQTAQRRRRESDLDDGDMIHRRNQQKSRENTRKDTYSSQRWRCVVLKERRKAEFFFCQAVVARTRTEKNECKREKSCESNDAIRETCGALCVAAQRKREPDKNGDFLWSRTTARTRAEMSATVLILTAVLVSVAVANKDDSNSGRFNWGSESRTTETDSALTSSSSEKSTSDSLDSDDLREARLARDQRRIEVAVQQALLKDRADNKFPAKPSYTTKSYQLSFTTLSDTVR
jgi:hypothetical protein